MASQSDEGATRWVLRLATRLVHPSGRVHRGLDIIECVERLSATPVATRIASELASPGEGSAQELAATSLALAEQSG